MQKLNRDDLYSLEEYARRRAAFRSQVMAHKADRQLGLGDNIRLYFEDRLTIHYQIQEMLRVERIFEEDGIQEELDAYNPLIPDGSNWKATMMVEYSDPEERRKALARLIGVEERVWMQVEGFPPVTPVADEDLERATEEKTSSVHFLRFELTDAMIRSLKHGAALSAGVDHSAYQATVERVPDAVRASLLADLD